MFVVPKGVRHNPIADEECHLLLIERKTTLHTGSDVTDKTRSIDEQLRPL
jgi:mannose-6-phosphate isomerase-like protein (cupin superfamily)